MSDVLGRCADLPTRALAAGDVLIAEGAPPGVVHILVDGVVDVSVGGATILTLGEPGTFLGELSVLLDQPASATVVAATPTTVHVLADPATTFQERPDLLLDVARLLARRVAALTSYLVDLREQYADAPGHLGMMDTVLTALMSADLRPADPGSDREVPDY
jgi:CRP-like cAMP-binding protein